MKRFTLRLLQTEQVISVRLLNRICHKIYVYFEISLYCDLIDHPYWLITAEQKMHAIAISSDFYYQIIPQARKWHFILVRSCLA